MELLQVKQTFAAQQMAEEELVAEVLVNNQSFLLTQKNSSPHHARTTLVIPAKAGIHLSADGMMVVRRERGVSFTTKIHLIANAHGLPVGAEITGGEASDYKGFDALVDDDLPNARVFLADRGYDSDHIRKTITERSGTPVIPGKKNRKVPIKIDVIAYALRNRIAAARLWIKSWST